ncbi:hypothetical protein LCGC14_2599610, partial [marine sediment metagenome]
MKTKRNLIVIVMVILVLLSAFLIPLGLIREEPKVIIKEEPEMQHRRYKDISITSAKIPANTHLWLEINSNGGFYFVATGDLTHLWYSADKMDTEAKIDVDPGDAWGGDDDHRPVNIVSAWHDPTNKLIYFIDNAGGNTIYAWKLDYSSSESTPTVTEMGTIAGLNAVTGSDIYKTGSNIAIIYNDADEIGNNWWVDPNWVNKHTVAIPFASIIGFVVVPSTGSFDYILRDIPVSNEVEPLALNKANGVIGGLPDISGTSFPAADLMSLSYDDSDFLTFVLTLDADGKEYLYVYSTVSDPGSFTQGAEFNVALMLDRNNRAIAPNEFEKAFGVSGTSDEIVYELKARRGGIIQLQDVGDIATATLGAITDNFLMTTGGQMLEWTEVSNEIDEIEYDYGIIGIPQVGFFIAHPDFQANW